jgi:hypothetical protein
MEVVGSRFGVAAATSLALYVGLALGGSDLSSAHPARGGVAVAAKPQASTAAIRTWIYVKGSKTRTYVVRKGHQMWAVYAGGTGGPCWVGRGSRGYTLLLYVGLSGPEYMSYAVPGAAGAWLFVDEQTPSVCSAVPVVWTN